MRCKPVLPEFSKDYDSWKYKLQSWWYDFAPVKWFYDTQTFIRRSKRLYHWSKFMWTNWDFDGQTVYPLLEYKLIRLQRCMINGHLVQDPKDLKAIKIAIKLAHRLSKDYHEEKLYDRHEKKWGELKTWSTPCEDRKGYFQYHSTRTKIKTEEDKKQEAADHLEMWNHEPKWRNRDEKWFFDILKTYLRRWWD